MVRTLRAWTSGGLVALALSLSVGACQRRVAPPLQAASPIRVGPNVHVSAARADRSHGELVLAADPEDPDRLLGCSMLFDWNRGSHEAPPSMAARPGFTPLSRRTDTLHATGIQATGTRRARSEPEVVPIS